jgi:tight adherence protein B
LQTGADVTVGSFVAMTAALFVAGVLLASVFRLPFWFSLASGVVLSLLPLQRMSQRRSKRLIQFENMLPEALDLMSRSMRAGHAFASALQLVGEEMPAPVGAEFRATFDEINFGVAAPDALLNLATRVPSTDLRFFVIAVLIQRETGGNLTEILDNISSIIRDRLKLHGRVRVLSAEGRLSALILSILPFAVAAGIFLLNSEHMSLLWTTQYGVYMVYTAMVMMFVGIIWIRNAVRIRV